jgi:hypothetical protein
MKKIIKLSIETAGMVALGIFLGLLLVKYFRYDEVIFIAINIGLIALAIVSAKKVTDALDKGKNPHKVFSYFSQNITKPIQGLIRKFQLNSILLAGIFFAFVGYIGYSATKSIVYFIFLGFYLLFYIRALSTYQRFHEFR